MTSRELKTSSSTAIRGCNDVKSSSWTRQPCNLLASTVDFSLHDPVCVVEIAPGLTGNWFPGSREIHFSARLRCFSCLQSHLSLVFDGNPDIEERHKSCERTKYWTSWSERRRYYFEKDVVRIISVLARYRRSCWSTWSAALACFAWWSAFDWNPSNFRSVPKLGSGRYDRASYFWR